MTKFDKQYLELCKRILTEGVEVENRTGINTLKIPSHTFTFNLEDEFPILESKQTAFKTAIIEMLWIWQMQSNDVRELTKRGVHIWDEWMVDEDGIYRTYDNKTKKLIGEKEFGKDWIYHAEQISQYRRDKKKCNSFSRSGKAPVYIV